MRLFQVRTKNHNTVTITARSSFHGRKLFAAKHEKTMGKLTSIVEIHDTKKPVVKLTASGRELS